MKSKKKRLIIILSSVGVIILLAFGAFGGKVYLDAKAKQEARQEQLKKNLAESKKEIVEILEWNYNDIHSVTFTADYGSKDDGVEKVSFDKSLTTTPAGGLFINGYVNGNEKMGLGATLDPDTMKIDGNFGDYPMLGGEGRKLYKNPHPVSQGDVQGPANFYLTPSDISDLKKQGYTKDITFEQIKHYFEGKKP